MNAERSTLILTRRAIAGSMPLEETIDAVGMAFSRYSEGGMHVPPVVHIPGVDGGFHVKSAGFSGPPSYVAVKINGNFPKNPSRRGLPTIQGAIALFDANDGFPLAIMDSAEVTSVRTAAATGVAARLLADPKSEVTTIVGCGVQGRIQLEALRLVLPIEQVYAHDADPDRAATFAEEVGGATGIAIEPVATLSEGTCRSDVIVTCTTATRAFLQPSHVRPGAFIAAIGADNPDKSELSPELMRASAVIVDVLEQCAQIGDLHHAIEAGAMTRDDVRAELGDLIRGVSPGRRGTEEVIVFDSTGSAIQDVAVAGAIYERARERGLGMKAVLA